MTRSHYIVILIAVIAIVVAVELKNISIYRGQLPDTGGMTVTAAIRE